MSVDEICQKIGADSLHYISEAGLAKAVGLAETCLACFNGNYLAGHPGEEEGKERMDEKSLVAS